MLLLVLIEANLLRGTPLDPKLASCKRLETTMVHLRSSEPWQLVGGRSTGIKMNQMAI